MINSSCHELCAITFSISSVLVAQAVRSYPTEFQSKCQKQAYPNGNIQSQTSKLVLCIYALSLVISDDETTNQPNAL